MKSLQNKIHLVNLLSLPKLTSNGIEKSKRQFCGDERTGITK
jgi:hypothetical protein